MRACSLRISLPSKRITYSREENAKTKTLLFESRITRLKLRGRRASTFFFRLSVLTGLIVIYIRQDEIGGLVSQSLSHLDSGSNEQDLMNTLNGTFEAHGDAVEARDQFHEMLRMVLVNHRYNNLGSSRNFLEELSNLFEDDEDGWSDDELCSIQEWLTALGLTDGWHPDADSSSEPGLNKDAIMCLPREAFYPDKSVTNSGSGNLGVTVQHDECSVCLERFLLGEMLTCLPCNHKFHPDCLTPWLVNHAQCPYCRRKVSLGNVDNGRSGGHDFPLNHEDLAAWMEAVDSGLMHMGIR